MTGASSDVTQEATLTESNCTCTRPAEPRLEQSNPDTAVLDATQRTQMCLIKCGRYVALERCQGHTRPITSVHRADTWQMNVSHGPACHAAAYNIYTCYASFFRFTACHCVKFEIKCLRISPLALTLSCHLRGFCGEFYLYIPNACGLPRGIFWGGENVQILMQDHKSLINTHTHRHTDSQTDRQLLTGDTISSAS